MLGNITPPLYSNSQTSKYEDLSYQHTNGHLSYFFYGRLARSEGGGSSRRTEGGVRGGGARVCRKREKNGEGGRSLPKPTGLRGNLPPPLDPRLFPVPTLSACYCTFLFSLQPLWGRLGVTHHPDRAQRRTLWSDTIFHSVFTLGGKK